MDSIRELAFYTLIPRPETAWYDLMEAVRPDVDAFLVNWITRETLKREWFFEQRNGNLSFDGIACNSVALRNRSDMESRPCTRCGADIRAGRHRPHP